MTKKNRDMAQDNDRNNERTKQEPRDEKGAQSRSDSDRQELGQDPRNRGEDVQQRNQNGSRQNDSARDPSRIVNGNRKPSDSSRDFSFNKSEEENIAGGESIEGEDVAPNTFNPNERRVLAEQRGWPKDRVESEDSDDERTLPERVEKQRQDSGRQSQNTKAPQSGDDGNVRPDHKSPRPRSSNNEHRSHH